MRDVIAVLDREHEHLQSLDGAAFLLRLPSYVSFVTEQHSLGPVLAEIEQETHRAHQAFVDQENEIIRKAIAIRDELVESGQNLAGFDDADLEELSWESDKYDTFHFSFARFDKLAAADVGVAFPTLPNDSVDPGPVSEMLNILRGKLRVAQFGEESYLEGTRENRRPDLDPIGDQLRGLLDQHLHQVRLFRQASRTLPGLALARLRYFASNLNPEPTANDAGQSLAERLDRALQTLWTPLWSVQKAISGQALDERERRRLAEVVNALKEQERLLHAELTRRASVAQISREAQLWRRFAYWLSGAVGGALVQIAVAALVGAAAGFVSGYLIGHGNGGGSRPDRSGTITVTTTAP